MTLPTFLLIGAMKAGTSSLHRYLGEHPDVFMSAPKEPDFFLGTEAWARGLEWYRSLFAPGARAVARGEASTRYSKDPLFPGVPERVAGVIPEVRLVYVLRHPVERIRSHHRHAVAEWGHPPSFADAVRWHRSEYLVPSRYAHQIDGWLAHFPPGQLLVVTSEDLDREHHGTVASVLTFLGVDPGRRPPSDDRRYNQGSDHRTSLGPVQRLRRVPAYRALRSRVPKRLRHAAWRATSRPAPRPQVADDGAVEDELVAELQPDLRRLAQLLPGFDCWGLLEERGDRQVDAEGGAVP